MQGQVIKIITSKASIFPTIFCKSSFISRIAKLFSPPLPTGDIFDIFVSRLDILAMALSRFWLLFINY